MVKDHEMFVLAKTIYGEARGEYVPHKVGLSGLIAVGNVIINRVTQARWFGKTIEEVCRKPQQFSCWNTNDPNYPILNAVSLSDPVYRVCVEVANNLIQSMYPDLTFGANHYHTTSISPAWARSMTLTCVIGSHRFYTDSRLSSFDVKH